MSVPTGKRMEISYLQAKCSRESLKTSLTISQKKHLLAEVAILCC
jgi:hypothetical protein